MSERNENSLRRIPLKADNPVPILFWEPVDFVAALTMLGMGVVMKMFLFGLIGFMLTLMIASKLRNGAKRGAAQHWLWYMGLSVDSALERLKLRSWNSDFIP